MFRLSRGQKVRASEVRLRYRRVIPYREVEEALREGGGYLYFIEGVGRQTAYSAARRLSRRLGFAVEAHSASYGGRRGYVFMRGSIDELRRRLEG
jgi:hypothetical protein